MDPAPIEISIQAAPDAQASWLALARRCESIGVRALLVSDHPGTGPSPFVALAAAASVTTRLRLGSCVSNAGVRHPLLLAGDVATLDVVSGGRAELGIGAGHTPAEFEMTGRTRPEPAERVAHLIAVASATRALLSGDRVPSGTLGALTDMTLDGPRPVQNRVPLLVGGGHPALLRWAGAHADVVGLSGLGRTLPDGHMHSVSWSAAQVDRLVRLVHEAAEPAEQRVPTLDVLVQAVQITNNREEAGEALAKDLAISPDDLLSVPFVLLGTTDQIIEQMRVARERWGISRWTLRQDCLEAAEQLITALRS